MKKVDKTRAELDEFMKSTGTAQNTVAMESGLSAAAVSQFLNGTYNGDNENIAETLRQYLALARERLSMSNSTRFYPELYNTEVVTAAARYAHRFCEMVLIRGDSGAGKTAGLKYYAENNAGVIFVTANSTVRTGSQIIREIAAASGKNFSGCSHKQVMEKLIKALEGTKRLIIIDEADRLSLHGLQAVRDLNDIAHVGIVLAGNNKLYTQMINGTRGGEFDQIRTRMPFKPVVYNDYIIEEIIGMFPGIKEDTADALLEKANSSSLREAVKMFNYALYVTDEKNDTLSAEQFNQVCETWL